jgi:hypothetical protein
MKNRINKWFHGHSTMVTVLLITMGMGSCKKFVRVDPPYTSFNGENVFTTNATAIAAVTSIYSTMSNSTISSGGIPSLSFFCGLSADELTLYPGSPNALFVAYYANELGSSPSIVPGFWTSFYSIIYLTNSAIEGLLASHSLHLARL